MEDRAETVLINLVYSIKNLRKNTVQIDLNQKRLQMIAIQMRRTSFLAELELRYVYALNCKGYQVGEGTTF